MERLTMVPLSATRGTRWRTIAGAVVFAAVVTLAGRCYVTARRGPTGFLGLKWGDVAAEGARGLGLVCDRWYPWIDPAFETSIDLDHPRVVLGAEGLVRLVRAGENLEGVQVIYRACAGDNARERQLREGLRRELHVESHEVDVPYEIWADDSLVHFAVDPRDSSCTLTVAAPRFAKAFGSALLSEGFRNFGTAARPR